MSSDLYLYLLGLLKYNYVLENIQNKKYNKANNH